MSTRNHLFTAALAGLLALTTVACEAEPGPRDFGDAPRSLEGTQVDGAFNFDADGALLFDDDAQRTFDYFLTAHGELEGEELDAWVASQLGAELGEGRGYHEALDAWQAYTDFRSAAAVILDDPQNAERPDWSERELLAALELHLGDTPFAASERARIEHAFELRAAYEIEDPQARSAELRRIDADQIARFEASRAGRFLAGHRAVEAARSEGADASTVAAIRAEHFDAIEPGAAERLAALDAKRAAWDQRVSAFRAEREALRTSFVGAPAELEAAVSELEAEHFDAREIRRVHALDELEG